MAELTFSGSGLNSSALLDILGAEDIVPGSAPSYETCKTLYTYHPLGKRLTDYPISVAMSQQRELSMGGLMELEDLLLDRFKRVWKKENIDYYLASVMSTARVYGAAALVYGAKGCPTDKPMPLSKIAQEKLYFNVLDPLNVAGSLILDQDPNAPNFQKPTYLVCNGYAYHSSRSCIIFNEKPIYLQFTDSSYGFSGRSVYQRPLFPLKSYINTLLTDNWVVEKAALLVATQKSPGNPIDQAARWFGNLKRSKIKDAKGGNVLQIGIGEEVKSVDLTNLKDAYELARKNIMDNIAISEDMPASMVRQESLAQGFGEGSEDAKIQARYVDGVRNSMNAAYDFVTPIVQRRAWDEEFYASLQQKFPTIYKKVPYETAYYQWVDAFEATWPNLLVEPDSEKVKVEDVTLKAAIATVEVMLPALDPDNKATAMIWLADVINEKKLLFKSTLSLNEAAIAAYEPPTPMDGPSEPKPENGET